MLKASKRISVMIFALFVLASLGIASSALAQVDQIGGLANVGPTIAYVNPGGMGDTLLYNYYNARNGMQTFFTVVNTSATQGQRVRIRFREAADVPNSLCVDNTGKGTAAGSYEVLDFDICLTNGDEWSGFVTAAPGGGAMLCSNDVDTLIWDGTHSNLFPGCVAFKFGSNNTANTGITADDTMEGYFEIIGEDQLVAGELKTCNPDGDDTVTPAIPSPDCDTAPNECAEDVPNVLFGNAALIDGNTSGTFAYDATAIASFTDVSIRQSPTTSQPTLEAAEDGLAGINFILTKDHVFTIYDLIHSRSEIVLTSPTKLLTQQQAIANVGCPDGLTQNVFSDDTALFTAWNDAEDKTQSICSFSPCGTALNTLPFEVNVLKLNISTAGVVSDILSSTVDQVVDLPFDFGWFDVDLNESVTTLTFPHESCFGGNTFSVAGNFVEGLFECSEGWPVLGLGFIDVDHGASTMAFPVQYNTDIFID